MSAPLRQGVGPMPNLLVYLDNGLAGRIAIDAAGAIRFRYNLDWLAAGRPPLSRSLPLCADELEATPFFSGLLPDGIETRQQLARLFQTSPENDFELLANIGRDCAGAVVISRAPIEATEIPDRRDLEPLDEAALAALVRSLPQRPLLVNGDDITLSLAGVHDKTAVYVDRHGQIHQTHHGYPTSHILKVDIRQLPDSARTEHFCLQVAAAAGLQAVKSEIRVAEDRVFMLVQRYDRVMVSSGDQLYLTRVHQEDFCQAMGVPPRLKYERDGGPNIAQMVDVLRQASSRPAVDIERFMRSVVFNYLIGNPDGHAKNSSMLRRSGVGRLEVSLAPIYDVNNAEAFRSVYPRQRPRLAQAIGGERDPSLLTEDHWRRLAKDARIGWGAFREIMIETAEAVGAAVRTKRAEIAGGLADSPLLDIVVEDVAARSDELGTMLARRPAPGFR